MHSQELNIVTALHDAELLMTICMKKRDLLPPPPPPPPTTTTTTTTTTTINAIGALMWINFDSRLWKARI